jgi:hypothetical protein
MSETDRTTPALTMAVSPAVNDDLTGGVLKFDDAFTRFSRIFRHHGSSPNGG